MAVIATAEVRVIADTSRFLSNLRRQLRGAFGNVGAQSAQDFTRNFERNLGSELTEAIRRAASGANRTMQRSGREAGDAFATGFQQPLRHVGRDFFDSLRIQTVIAAAGAQGSDVGDAFVDNFRSTMRERMTGAMREALEPFENIPPVFRRIGNESGSAFVGDFFTSSSRSRLRIAAEEIIGEIDARIASASTGLRDRGNTVMRDFASGLRRGQAEVAAAAEQAAEEAARAFQEALAPEPSGFVTDFLDGIESRQRQINLGMRQSGIAAFQSFRDGVADAQQQLSTGINPIRMQRDGEAAGEGLLTGLRRRLGTGAARISLQFGRNLRTNLISQATNIGSQFSNAFQNSLINRASGIGNTFLNLIRRALGRNIESEADASGRRTGNAFSRGLSGVLTGLTAGVRGLGRALSAISLRPLAGLGRLLADASSEMVSTGAQVLALLGLLEALSGILFALPAAINVLGAAVATAAVAFNGFGSAISAAFEDADAFNDAIQDLAPAAQAIAREFRAIAPSLTELRLDVQNSLFSQLGGTITNVANNLLGPLREGMNVAATALGGLIANIGEFLSQSASADTVTATFETLATIFDALAASAAPFLEGMRTLADEFLPRIAETAGPIASLGDQFRAWTDEVTRTGAAMEAFDFAISVFQTLAGIVGDLAGIFQAMFSAAELAGVNALGAIGEALETIRAAFESFEGQVALANVFGAIGDAVNALAPVFGTLLTQLGLVFPIIAQIAEAIGPSLSVVLEGLGQALLALGPGVIEVFAGIAAAAEAIAPSLAPLGEALGAVLSAIAPILPVIGQLISIVVELGAQIIGVLASAITPIVEALAGALAPILPQIADLFSRLVEAVAPVVQALGEGLANVIATLLPPILELVVALADALMPIIEALLPVLTPIIEIFFQLVNVIGSLLVPVISLLLPIIEALAPLFELIGLVLAPLLELFSAILEPITTLITLIAEALSPVIQFLAEIIGAIIDVALVPLTAAFTFLADIIAEHVIPWIEQASLIMQVWWEQFIQPLIERVRDLASTVSDRFGSIRDTIGTVGDFISGAIETVMGWFDDFGSTVSTVVSNVDGFLDDMLGVFQDVFNSIVDAVSGAADTVSGIIDGIVGAVQSAIDTVSNLGSIDLNPFANGGIVTRPTPALIGEAGKEVVIPLTRPSRAVDLAQQSGLIDLLAARGAMPGSQNTPGVPTVGEFHVHSQNADPEQVARRAARIIERRMSGRGLERVS